jgi:hypothetical protein
MVTMDHADATLTGAAERYILGDMNEQERERYEEHFFSCADCADEVRTAARFVENARPLLHEEPQVLPAPARPVVVDAGPSWWAGLLAAFRPLPLGALAAGLVLVGLIGYQSLIQVPGLRQQLREAEALQTAPSYFLSIARGEPAVIAVTPNERLVSLTLSRSFDRAFPFYRFDVQNANGQSVVSDTLRAPVRGDELQILLPVRGLPAGSYVIVVAGLDSQSSQTPASDSVHYPFTLDRRESAR